MITWRTHNPSILCSLRITNFPFIQAIKFTQWSKSSRLSPFYTGNDLLPEQTRLGDPPSVPSATTSSSERATQNGYSIWHFGTDTAWRRRRWRRLVLLPFNKSYRSSNGIPLIHRLTAFPAPTDWVNSHFTFHKLGNGFGPVFGSGHLLSLLPCHGRHQMARVPIANSSWPTNGWTLSRGRWNEQWKEKLIGTGGPGEQERVVISIYLLPTGILKSRVFLACFGALLDERWLFVSLLLYLAAEIQPGWRKLLGRLIRRLMPPTSCRVASHLAGKLKLSRTMMVLTRNDLRRHFYAEEARNLAGGLVVVLVRCLKWCFSWE